MRMLRDQELKVIVAINTVIPGGKVFSEKKVEGERWGIQDQRMKVTTTMRMALSDLWCDATESYGPPLLCFETYLLY